MTPRERFLGALRGDRTDAPAVGNPTSIATADLMETTGCFFPEVHTNAEKMATLAAAGYERLGYDTIMPYFSVVQEAAAMGATIDWADKGRMPSVRPSPDTGRYLCEEPDQIEIPRDFLDRLSTRTILDALRILKRRYGDEVALVGKVFGPWTLGYHLFGTENFLLLVLDDPEKLRRILARLMEITVLFGQAQIEAGADCLTLGDHLTGDLCRAETYRDFLLPAHQQLARGLPCPVILHTCGYTLDRMPYIAQSGFAAFHFDSRNDAKKAMEMVAGRIRLIGNVNNPDTLYGGKTGQVEREVAYALEAGVAVIGPECAVPVNMNSRSLRHIAEAARGTRFT
ncbi:MAG: MtaA/CmuA family methyltransferase [Verrucomicrobia bacterium]|nr:MtaA/CmuA family methyltransferase [Verrucomicrobiota bacterium]